MSRFKLWLFYLCLLANIPSPAAGQILDPAGNLLPRSLQNQPLEVPFIQDIGDVIKTLPSPTVLRGLTFKEDKLWGVTSSGFGGTGSGVLYEIDADTGTVGSILNISPSLPVTFGLGYDLKRDLFIVTDCKVDMIFKVDPANGNVIDSFPSPGSVPVGAAFDSTRDGYWISDSNDVVDLVSPETGAVISSLPAPFGASRIAGTGYDPCNDVLMSHSRDSAETYQKPVMESRFPCSPLHPLLEQTTDKGLQFGLQTCQVI